MVVEGELGQWVETFRGTHTFSGLSTGSYTVSVYDSQQDMEERGHYPAVEREVEVTGEPPLPTSSKSIVTKISQFTSTQAHRLYQALNVSPAVLRLQCQPALRSILVTLRLLSVHAVPSIEFALLYRWERKLWCTGYCCISWLVHRMCIQEVEYPHRHCFMYSSDMFGHHHNSNCLDRAESQRFYRYIQ